jgi:glycerol uptake facilitator protein
MNPYLAEFVGTALLILFGDGVVACVLLNKSKGQGGGWIVITTGVGSGGDDGGLRGGHHQRRHI